MAGPERRRRPRARRCSAAIQQLAGPATKVTYSADGTGADGADVAVVVVGETPYAEMHGRPARSRAVRRTTWTTIANAKKAGIPVVVVLFSGRPLIINDALRAGRRVRRGVAAGHRRPGHRPTCCSATTSRPGKLPVSWPKSMAQIPINVGDANYDPLFPFGFGLTY